MPERVPSSRDYALFWLRSAKQDTAAAIRNMASCRHLSALTEQAADLLEQAMALMNRALPSEENQGEPA